MMITEKDKIYLRMAMELAKRGVEEGQGGPFGCVIVKDGAVVGKGCNGVTSTNDPTAHAEVMAIRDACGRLGHYQLTGCVVYASCEPCPMCLGALYWARPDRVFYAASRSEAAEAGFDDAFIYAEIGLPDWERRIPFVHSVMEESGEVFRLWKEKGNKRLY
ncbi:MAG: nucleoside deaminase [Bacteroidetes bacterium]|nr:nucleoside deaminase [Bacteroidota bacterium]